jgi:radical SAM superfamily enzyme
MEVDVLRKRLEQIMKQDDLTMLNVASEADLTEDCVRDFVNGVTEAPRRKTLQGIRRVIDSRTLGSPQTLKGASG